MFKIVGPKTAPKIPAMMTNAAASAGSPPIRTTVSIATGVVTALTAAVA